MPRVKTGVTHRHRHANVLALTRGHQASRRKLFRRAHESMLKALSYAYRHRRERKRDMRQLWITRINAAARQAGLTYSQFMTGLKVAGVILNRKTLAELAAREPAAFSQLVTRVKQPPE